MQNKGKETSGQILLPKERQLKVVLDTLNKGKKEQSDQLNHQETP